MRTGPDLSQPANASDIREIEIMRETNRLFVMLELPGQKILQPLVANDHLQFSQSSVRNRKPQAGAHNIEKTHDICNNIENIDRFLSGSDQPGGELPSGPQSSPD
jgi:hypothetical protein